MKGFLHFDFGGLISGGAYFRNFTVYSLGGGGGLGNSAVLPDEPLSCQASKTYTFLIL